MKFTSTFLILPSTIVVASSRTFYEAQRRNLAGHYENDFNERELENMARGDEDNENDFFKPARELSHYPERNLRLEQEMQRNLGHFPNNIGNLNRRRNLSPDDEVVEDENDEVVENESSFGKIEARNSLIKDGDAMRRLLNDEVFYSKGALGPEQEGRGQAMYSNSQSADSFLPHHRSLHTPVESAPNKVRDPHWERNLIAETEHKPINVLEDEEDDDIESPKRFLTPITQRNTLTKEGRNVFVDSMSPPKRRNLIVEDVNNHRDEHTYEDEENEDFADHAQKRRSLLIDAESLPEYDYNPAIGQYEIPARRAIFANNTIVECKFPFQFHDKIYSTCQDFLKDGRMYCGTKEMSTCAQSDLAVCLPPGGMMSMSKKRERLPCVFPFRVEHDKHYHVHTACVSSKYDSDLKWCGTKSIIPDEYAGDDWGYCESDNASLQKIEELSKNTAHGEQAIDLVTEVDDDDTSLTAAVRRDSTFQNLIQPGLIKAKNTVILWPLPEHSTPRQAESIYEEDKKKIHVKKVKNVDEVIDEILYHLVERHNKKHVQEFCETYFHYEKQGSSIMEHAACAALENFEIFASYLYTIMYRLKDGDYNLKKLPFRADKTIRWFYSHGQPLMHSMKDSIDKDQTNKFQDSNFEATLLKYVGRTTNEIDEVVEEKWIPTMKSFFSAPHDSDGEFPHTLSLPNVFAYDKIQGLTGDAMIAHLFKKNGKERFDENEIAYLQKKWEGETQDEKKFQESIEDWVKQNFPFKDDDKIYSYHQVLETLCSILGHNSPEDNESLAYTGALQKLRDLTLTAQLRAVAMSAKIDVMPRHPSLKNDFKFVHRCFPAGTKLEADKTDEQSEEQADKTDDQSEEQDIVEDDTDVDEDCVKEGIKYDEPEYIVTADLPKLLVVYDPQQCRRECLKTDKCEKWNFDKKWNHCHLIQKCSGGSCTESEDSSKYAGPRSCKSSPQLETSTQTSQGDEEEKKHTLVHDIPGHAILHVVMDELLTYLRKDLGLVKAGTCFAGRCQNNGTCNTETAKCECPRGWTGDFCEIEPKKQDIREMYQEAKDHDAFLAAQIIKKVAFGGEPVNNLINLFPLTDLRKGPTCKAECLNKGKCIVPASKNQDPWCDCDYGFEGDRCDIVESVHKAIKTKYILQK